MLLILSFILTSLAVVSFILFFFADVKPITRSTCFGLFFLFVASSGLVLFKAMLADHPFSSYSNFEYVAIVLSMFLIGFLFHRHIIKLVLALGHKSESK